MNQYFSQTQIYNEKGANNENKIINLDRRRREYIAHGVNIQAIAVLTALLSLYFHIHKNLKIKNIDTNKSVRYIFIILLAIVLISHIAPDLIAHFDDSLLNKDSIHYDLTSSLTIFIVEIFMIFILLLPLLLIKNIRTGIAVVYILTTFVLLINNIFILNNDFYTTLWHLSLDYGIALVFFLIINFLNKLSGDNSLNLA
jgi:hypothetical protein